jgi:hypothetical protein
MPVSKFWHIHGYILLLFVQDVRVMYTPTCTCACVARTTHVTVLPGPGVLDYIVTYTVRAVDHRCNFPVVQSRCHRLITIVPPLCCWAVPGIVGHAITCLIVILKHKYDHHEKRRKTCPTGSNSGFFSNSFIRALYFK